ncbi:MAG: hypothetical protein COB30_008865 [Ectothiorhodospiraceae bacterium]|nr:hypothetical protein [Ectothiorhodospiraceae bacterium]
MDGNQKGPFRDRHKNTISRSHAPRGNAYIAPSSPLVIPAHTLWGIKAGIQKTSKNPQFSRIVFLTLQTGLQKGLQTNTEQPKK